jgi:hypothetical protein
MPATCRAFGAGPLAGLKLPKPGEVKERDMTTIMLFGDSKAVELAQRMIEEAVDNKEAKAKARAKEYERKRDQKRRDRQIYHLRWAAGRWCTLYCGTCTAAPVLCAWHRREALLRGAVARHLQAG